MFDAINSCCDGDGRDMIGRLIERESERGCENDVVQYVTDSWERKPTADS